VHVPALHTSLVHWLPSSVHDPVRFTCWQPPSVVQLSIVQSL
jgi:hypothetical protein